MTNEQINRMAAEVLGMPDRTRGAHFCQRPNSVRIRVVDVPSDTTHWTCSECGSNEIHFYTDDVSTPDFCDDLNAAQRLVYILTDFDTRDVFEDAVIKMCPWIEDAFSDVTGMAIVHTLLLHAKTITLAGLVALGKITLEEAKESL